MRLAEPAPLDAWRAACRDLLRAPKLAWLDLVGCGLDAGGVETLAASLSGGSSLTWVDLRRNPLGDGAASLVAAFEACPYRRAPTLRYQCGGNSHPSGALNPAAPHAARGDRWRGKPRPTGQSDGDRYSHDSRV